MGIVLNIETATTNCSVSVAKDGVLLAIKELNSGGYSHAEKLHLFIEEVITEAQIAKKEINAVAVSKGPGSYTGLRIGVSAAKGLCYALDVPLIAVSTLKSMSAQLKDVPLGAVLIPVLDARRMEVYAAVFNDNLDQIRETRAEVITKDSFKDYIGKSEVHFLGSGASKIKEVLFAEEVYFHETLVPSAKEMAALSHKKYTSAAFEDVAYFEPFYLKDFVLLTKKK